MANLISGLESVLSIKPGISDKLKSHVSMIDVRLNGSAMEATRNQVFDVPLAGATNESTIIPNDPIENVGGIEDTLGWTFALSPDQQMQLQSDLTSDWPFDFETNGFLDFLGDLPTSEPTSCAAETTNFLH